MSAGTSQWRGLGVSPGRAVARILHMPDPVREPPVGAELAEHADPQEEADRIKTAAEKVQRDLVRRAAEATSDARGVLEATQAMAADPALLDTARDRVLMGATPERALWDTAEEFTQMLSAAGGALGERVRDVQDVRDRLLAVLQGLPTPGVPTSVEPFVLIARDLAPVDTAMLDLRRCRALLTEEGGPTSHTAIVARSLGLPAIVAVRGVCELISGTLVLVDGGAGTIDIDPDPQTAADAVAASGVLRNFDGHGRTKDGHDVELLANVSDAASAQLAARAGAQGVGLFRTELCFLGNDEPPSVAEQVEAYRQVMSAFPGKKVVVRTLDAGADKPLPFLASVQEANPALGVRGVRTTLEHEQVLDDQLRAIAQAAAHEQADVWVMAPMVATKPEAADFVKRAHDHGLGMAGIMIEVPAAAMMAPELLDVAGFASIGTNDLTQYTMAADRMLSGVAELNDPWQPATLRLVQMTGLAGDQQHRPVGICGEAAADPVLACVLVGLGVTSLSMSPRALGDVATVLGAITHARCRELAEIARAAPDAVTARDRVRSAMQAESTVLADHGL
ncbi:MAG TPA: phosphoenolpyruvate--protein phosphotransferase [Jiangellaceae bacterium]|nr:phosphoenolpyruvate--protein phosphotransferase [Jiangellaceae bacterium]